MKAAFLTARGLVRVSGPDARDWLQSLITNDINKATSETACFAALLTPQGKILFDFLIFRRGGDYLLDCARDQAEALAKRLTMYRLRAKVTIVDMSGTLSALAVWGTDSKPSEDAVRDPRHADLGWRIIVTEGDIPENLAVDGFESDFEAARIAAGVPEGGRDFSWGDIFPHDANMDELDGVDFKKGCYIGQEVVSRVEHRGTARKRFRLLEVAGGTAEPGNEILAGDTPIGTITAVSGKRGLGLIRIDRAAEAKVSGTDLQAGGADIEIPSLQ